ncbi:MAG: hypothetical protein ABIS86_01005, partial [Streptosporangiaceae bacterium]
RGDRGEAATWLRPDPLSPDDATVVDRVLGHLEVIAPIWSALPVGGAITFAWPRIESPTRTAAPSGR